MKPEIRPFKNIVNMTLATALLCTVLAGASAQRNRSINPATGGMGQLNGNVSQRGAGIHPDPTNFGNVFTFGAGVYGYGGPGFFIVPGYSQYTDPPMAITPSGIIPLGYGDDGYGNYGFGYLPYGGYMNGYADALNNMDANGVNPDQNNAPDNGWTGYVITRVPHGNDQVGAKRLTNGMVALRWQGNPKNISSITFALTDSKGRVLRSQTITSPPAEVRFNRPANASFYEAFIRYIDGASNTVMSPIK